MTHSLKLSSLVLAGLAFCTVPVLHSCNSNQPVNEQMKDSAITGKIKAKYAGDSEVKGRNISVNTEEGIVYLTGRVSTQAEKEEAEKLARQTDGVKDVVNHIKVGDRD